MKINSLVIMLVELIGNLIFIFIPQPLPVPPHVKDISSNVSLNSLVSSHPRHDIYLFRDVKNFNFSNQGIKHVFVHDSKNLVAQDRNGDNLWNYTSICRHC